MGLHTLETISIQETAIISYNLFPTLDWGLQRLKIQFDFKVDLYQDLDNVYVVDAVFLNALEVKLTSMCCPML